MTDNDKNNNANEEVKDSSKRKFLKDASIATGGVVGGVLLGGYFGNPFKSETTTTTDEDKEKVDFSETRQFFKREEDFEVLSIATERIFPKDDNGPGAIALGVPYFIDKQLAGPWGENAKMYMKRPFQKDENPLTNGDMFLQGVRKINDVSKEQYDGDFVDLDTEQQNDILEAFEQDEVDMGRVSSATFFTRLIQSTLEGVYSDPMYGGNKNMQGWAMKQYPGPRMSNINLVDKGFEAIEELDIKSLKTH